MRGRWTLMRGNNRLYEEAQGYDKQRLADIRADDSKPAAQKRREAAPIEKAMQERYTAFQGTRDGHRAAARADQADGQPTAQCTVAAYAEPSKVAALLAVFGAASGPERLAFARLAAADNDVSAAYAMKRVLARDPATTDDAQQEHLAIGAACAKVTAAAQREADAEFLAFQAEAGRLDILGWQCDPATTAQNENVMLRIANDTSVLPREDGSLYVVSDKERAELLALAGVPEAGA